MPSKLTKTINRETAATIFEKSQVKEIIVSIEPTRNGALIGFRLKGTRDTYRLPVGSLYVRAVDHHLGKVEKKARQLHKEEKLPMRSARSRATKSLKEDLR